MHILSFIAKMTHLIFVIFTINILIMLLPITIRMINTTTGEVLLSRVMDNFDPHTYETKDYLYRYIDCFIRGLDKLGEDTLRLELYSNKYPAQPNIF